MLLFFSEERENCDSLGRILIQYSPPIRLFGYKEFLHIVSGLQVPIVAYV